VTYYWKDPDKGYKFASHFISIENLHAKLWALKLVKVLNVGISKLSLGNFGTK